MVLERNWKIQTMNSYDFMHKQQIDLHKSSIGMDMKKRKKTEERITQNAYMEWINIKLKAYDTLEYTQLICAKIISNMMF